MSNPHRRNRIDLFTPAEKAIFDAVGVVEAAGADVRLTKAVCLLQEARAAVADFVDGVEPKPEPVLEKRPVHDFESSFQELCEHCARKGYGAPQRNELRGGFLISVSGVRLPIGWNRPTATILFLAPGCFPFVPPEHFWIEPGQFRLADGRHAMMSHDNNAIPGEANSSRSATWFGWRVQSWNPNRLGLKTYLRVVLDRLELLK